MDKNIYLVGGWVRDTLLGKSPKDKDYVAVGYTPEEFEAGPYKKVGKSFPVYLNEAGDEVALARTEKSLGAGYGDFSVNTSNVTLKEDLGRRDLSVNAMAQDSDGTIIDPYNGQADIKAKVLRHVSDAFFDDPVRVLRLARFRATLGKDWKIAPDTKVLVSKMKLKLYNLTGERVWKEVQRVISEGVLVEFLYTLYELRVLNLVFPEIYDMILTREGSVHHSEANLFEHTMMVLSNLRTKSEVTQLAGLYHDVVKPITYQLYGNGAGHDDEKLLERMVPKWIPTGVRDKVINIAVCHLKIFKLREMRPSKVITLINRFRGNTLHFTELLELSEADSAGREALDGYDKKTVIEKELAFQIFEELKEITVPKDLQGNSTEFKRDYILQKKILLIKSKLKEG